MYAMVVDTDRNQLKSIIDCIKNEIRDAEFVMFTDPVKAAEYIKYNPIEILFTAISMDGFLGINLAAILNESQPAVPVVFTSDFDQDALYAIRSHATGFILNPVTKEQIYKALENTKFAIED